MDHLLTALAQAQPSGTADLINDLARTPLSQVLKFIAVLTIVRLACYPYLRNTPVHLRTGLYRVVQFVNEVMDAFVYAGAFVFLVIRPFFVQTFQIPSGSMWPTLHVNDYILANKTIYRYSDPKFGDIVVFRPPVRAANPDQIDENGEVKVDFIKRLIGEPGDVIELREGVLYRNGKIAGEEFRHYSRPSRGPTFTELPKEELANMTVASFKLVMRDGKIVPLNYTPYDANSMMPRGAPGDMLAPYVVSSDFAIDSAATELALRKQEPQRVPAGYYLMMGDNRNGSFDSRGWGLVKREAVIGRAEFIWFPIARWQRTK